MYAQFFGLDHEPFSIAPDPRYLFMSERHREALAHLLYGVGGGGGFVLLSGEIGTGKTTVCRCFLEQIPKQCNVAYIFNPKLTAAELLRSVCDEFHVPYAAANGGAPSAKDYVDALNGFLLRTHAEGQNNVLIIDEAQMLSADVLEQLRLLTNLETSERKLLQIMLIGQPELRTMLARPELEQLAQRVIARFHLDALTEAETGQYIQHRLAVAGLKGAMPFDRKALRRIHQLARGVPRRINLLCDRAMLGAYATGKGTIDKGIVDKAAGEVFESTALTGQRGPRVANLALLGAGVVAGGICVAGAVFFAGAGPNGRVGGHADGGVDGLTPGGPAASASRAATPSPGRAPAAGASAAWRTPSSAAAAATGAPAPLDLKAGLAAFAPDENAALRELATAWRLALPEGKACELVEASQVQCFRSTGSLPLLRQLGRPAVLTLQGDAGKPVYAVLTGLGEETATLRGGNATYSVPLAALAGLWHGEFATLWRAPPGYTGKMQNGGAGPAIDWLSTRIAAAGGQPMPAGAQRLDAGLQARMRAFQLSHGLAPDGRAGPMTFMQLNRATGVDEPHLTAGR